MRKERLDRIEHCRTLLRLEDLLAQSAATGYAVGEPARKLLHLADAIAMPLIPRRLARGSNRSRTVRLGLLFQFDLVDQHAEVIPDHPVPIHVGRQIIGAYAK